MSRIDVSILIVNYKTPELLERCLATLIQTRFPFAIEIIVVDNDSRDDSAARVRANFPSVTLLENGYNYGFAVANNQAYARARGRYVMPLNPDTQLQPGCLERLVAYLDAHEDVGMTVPLTLDGNGEARVPLHHFRTFDPPALLRMYQSRRPRPTLPTQPVAVEWAWTTGFLCRRAALGEGALFSEEMFLFTEEYKLCRRLRDAGYKLVILPDARLTHHASVTWNRSDEKLAVARRLGMAALWNIHRHEHGRALATLNQLFIGVESAVLWAGMYVEGLIKRARRPIVYVDYKAQTLASLGLVCRQEAYVAQANQRARRFFNGGADPP
jgi:GT2 family glycosyltransferase